MNRELAELDRMTRAALAEASVMRRPFGSILGSTTRAAIDLERRGKARPAEVERFFDGLTRFTQSLETPR